MINKNKTIGTEKKSEVILPLRIQAYERMALFLERIKLENIVLRIDSNGLTVNELQASMLQEIRQELNHNAAQQIYISAECWDKILEAVKYTQIIIQQSGSNLEANATSKDYLYNLLANNNNMPIKEALNSLKTEVQKLF